jgi:hypothetical protein
MGPRGFCAIRRARSGCRGASTLSAGRGWMKTAPPTWASTAISPCSDGSHRPGAGTPMAPGRDLAPGGLAAQSGYRRQRAGPSVRRHRLGSGHGAVWDQVTATDDARGMRSVRGAPSAPAEPPSGPDPYAGMEPSPFVVCCAGGHEESIGILRFASTSEQDAAENKHRSENARRVAVRHAIPGADGLGEADRSGWPRPPVPARPLTDLDWDQLPDHLTGAAGEAAPTGRGARNARAAGD